MRRHCLTSIPSGFALAFAAPPAWADVFGRYADGHMMGWGGMIFGSIMMLLFFALAVFLAVLAVRWLVGTERTAAPGGKNPLEILRERFARGEIDREEFEDRRKVLEA